eukprot:gene2039-2509_t
MSRIPETILKDTSLPSTPIGFFERMNKQRSLVSMAEFPPEAAPALVVSKTLSPNKPTTTDSDDQKSQRERKFEQTPIYQSTPTTTSDDNNDDEKIIIFKPKDTNRLTAKRRAWDDYAFLYNREEVRSWLELCLEHDFEEEDLFESLIDGIWLCKLVNIIKPGIVKKIHRKNSPSYMKLENINFFLCACLELGVSADCLFSPIDLYEKKNLKKVIYCLLALSIEGSKRGFKHKLMITHFNEANNNNNSKSNSTTTTNSNNSSQSQVDIPLPPTLTITKRKNTIKKKKQQQLSSTSTSQESISNTTIQTPTPSPIVQPTLNVKNENIEPLPQTSTFSIQQSQSNQIETKSSNDNIDNQQQQQQNNFLKSSNEAISPVSPLNNNNNNNNSSNDDQVKKPGISISSFINSTRKHRNSFNGTETKTSFLSHQRNSVIGIAPINPPPQLSQPTTSSLPSNLQLTPDIKSPTNDNENNDLINNNINNDNNDNNNNSQQHLEDKKEEIKELNNSEEITDESTGDEEEEEEEVEEEEEEEEEIINEPSLNDIMNMMSTIEDDENEILIEDETDLLIKNLTDDIEENNTLDDQSNQESISSDNNNDVNNANDEIPIEAGESNDNNIENQEEESVESELVQEEVSESDFSTFDTEDISTDFSEVTDSDIATSSTKEDNSQNSETNYDSQDLNSSNGFKEEPSIPCEENLDSISKLEDLAIDNEVDTETNQQKESILVNEPKSSTDVVINEKENDELSISQEIVNESIDSKELVDNKEDHQTLVKTETVNETVEDNKVSVETMESNETIFVSVTDEKENELIISQEMVNESIYNQKLVDNEEDHQPLVRTESVNETSLTKEMVDDKETNAINTETSDLTNTNKETISTEIIDETSSKDIGKNEKTIEKDDSTKENILANDNECSSEISIDKEPSEYILDDGASEKNIISSNLDTSEQSIESTNSESNMSNNESNIQEVEENIETQQQKRTSITGSLKKPVQVPKSKRFDTTDFQPKQPPPQTIKSPLVSRIPRPLSSLGSTKNPEVLTTTISTPPTTPTKPKTTPQPSTPPASKPKPSSSTPTKPLLKTASPIKSTTPTKPTIKPAPTKPTATTVKKSASTTPVKPTSTASPSKIPRPPSSLSSTLTNSPIKPTTSSPPKSNTKPIENSSVNFGDELDVDIDFSKDVRTNNNSPTNNNNELVKKDYSYHRSAHTVADHPVYKPIPNDATDRLLGEFINNTIKKILPPSIYIPSPIVRLSANKYKWGDTVVSMRCVNNIIVVRVGGGWMTLKDFLIRYNSVILASDLDKVSEKSLSENGNDMTKLQIQKSYVKDGEIKTSQALSPSASKGGPVIKATKTITTTTTSTSQILRSGTPIPFAKPGTSHLRSGTPAPFSSPNSSSSSSPDTNESGDIHFKLGTHRTTVTSGSLRSVPSTPTTNSPSKIPRPPSSLSSTLSRTLNKPTSTTSTSTSNSTPVSSPSKIPSRLSSTTSPTKTTTPTKPTTPTTPTKSTTTTTTSTTTTPKAATPKKQNLLGSLLRSEPQINYEPIDIHGNVLYDPEYKNFVVHSLKDNFDVYIGRKNPLIDEVYSTKYGNPFKVGVHGDRNECIKQYRDWIFHPDQKTLFNEAKSELRGKILGCFCSPLNCHGIILAEIANSPSLNTTLIGTDQNNQDQKSIDTSTKLEKTKNINNFPILGSSTNSTTSSTPTKQQVNSNSYAQVISNSQLNKPTTTTTTTTTTKKSTNTPILPNIESNDSFPQLGVGIKIKNRKH